MLVSQLLFLPALAAALPAQQAASACADPPVRKEWRQLSTVERESYVKAVQCLTTKPSRIGLNTTLYEDFPYVHQNLDKSIHFVAGFLPWHRYFVHVYEQALKECGYDGTATYWDWTLDSDDPVNSSIWDAETGIGGNGDQSTDKHCVTDGPFKDFRPTRLGTQFNHPHCLARNFNNGTSTPGDMIKSAYTPEAVDEVQAIGDYKTYRGKLEGGPHGAIHSAVGGDMSPATSPNDPLFFLHHGQIDRLWWLWQQERPETRNVEFAGRKTQDAELPEVSLEDNMAMMGLADDVMAKAVMTTDTALLCYRY